MTTMRKELSRLSDTLLWRGVAFMILGVAALIWPEPILVGALLTVALLAALLGLYEMTIAASIRRRTSRWWLVLAHGVLSGCDHLQLSVLRRGLRCSFRDLADCRWCLAPANARGRAQPWSLC